MKRVLITGASGLIGGEVLKLLSTGDKKLQLFGLDNRWDSEERIQSQSESKIQCDITSPDVTKVLSDVSPDVVIHAAAHPGGKSALAPTENVAVNALGSMRLFEWCSKNQRRVLFLSSSIVYGESAGGRLVESDDLQPGTIYGVTKAACESWLNILHDAYDLDWIVLRLFSTYGAGHRPSLDQGIINVMLTQLRRGNIVISKGSLARRRDLLHVADAAQAIALTLAKWPSRRIMNICTGRSTTVRELIELLVHLEGRNINEIDIQEVEGTVGDPVSNVGNPELAAQLLGFRARIDLWEGLRLTLDPSHSD